MNRSPIMTAGPAMMTEALRENLLFMSVMAIYHSPRRMKSTPPVRSNLHATKNTAKSRNDGMRCMNSATKVWVRVYPSPKTSRENMLTNRMKMIPSIRGVQ